MAGGTAVVTGVGSATGAATSSVVGATFTGLYIQAAVNTCRHERESFLAEN